MENGIIVRRIHIDTLIDKSKPNVLYTTVKAAAGLSAGLRYRRKGVV